MPKLYVALCPTLGLLLSGCLQGVSFDLGEPTTNPRLRPDLAPLSSDQMPSPADPLDPGYFASIDGTRPAFDDGGPGEDELVTATVPSMMNVPGGGSARGLVRSPCYWVGARDRIELRWEIVIPFSSEDAHPDDVRAAGCYLYLDAERAPGDAQSGFEPFTRRSALHPDTGDPIHYAGGITTLFGGGVELERQRAGLEYPDPDGVGCFEPTSGPGMDSEEIPILTCTNFPGGWSTCNPKGCPVYPSSAPTAAGEQARDVVFRVRLATPTRVEMSSDGTMSSDLPQPRNWLRLAGPTYRVVESSRVFRAELELDVMASLGPADELVYTWSMPKIRVGENDGPAANFHPSLDSNVRLFVERDGRVVPLDPKRVQAHSAGTSNPVVDCLPDARSAHTHDRIRTCRNGNLHPMVNPVAWPIPLEVGDEPLDWTVTFDYKDDPLAFGPDAYGAEELRAPDGAVYIEFTVFEPAYAPTSADAYRVTPSHIRFGDTKKSGVKTSLGWFENLTNNSLRILGAHFDDGLYFTLRPLQFPFDVGPGESFQFEVSVAPGTNAPAHMQDMLHFEVQGAGSGNPNVFRSVKLSAEAVEGAIAGVSPSSLTLWVQPGEGPDNQRDRRRVLIENRGTHAFTREPVVVSNDAYSAFSIVPGSTDPRDDPGVAALLPPGTSSVFEVVFAPPGSGSYNASLELKHDAENGPKHTLSLLGYTP